LTWENSLIFQVLHRESLGLVDHAAYFQKVVIFIDNQDTTMVSKEAVLVTRQLGLDKAILL